MDPRARLEEFLRRLNDVQGYARGTLESAAPPDEDDVVSLAEMVERAVQELRQSGEEVSATAERPIPDNPWGDVGFVAEGDYGNVLSYEIGWGHGSRSGFDSDDEWSAYGFGIYEGGDLHDGFRSLQEVLDTFKDGVYLSLADYRAGKVTPIATVVNAARRWANLPPVEQTSQAGLEGSPETSEDD